MQFSGNRDFCRVRLTCKQFSGTAHSLNFCGGFTNDDHAAIVKAKRTVLYNKETFTIHPEFGIIIEAMACGIPVILPDTGGFPEIVAATGGGVTYSPNTPDALAEVLIRLFRDKTAREASSAAARNSVMKEFNNLNMAKKAIASLR